MGWVSLRDDAEERGGDLFDVQHGYPKVVRRERLAAEERRANLREQRTAELREQRTAELRGAERARAIRDRDRFLSEQTFSLADWQWCLPDVHRALARGRLDREHTLARSWVRHARSLTGRGARVLLDALVDAVPVGESELAALQELWDALGFHTQDGRAYPAGWTDAARLTLRARLRGYVNLRRAA
jgi:hypothetical protein